MHHAFPFDPTHGFALDALQALSPPPPPPDFDAFWRERRERALKVDPNPRATENGAHPHWRIHDIAYSSTDGFEIGGWLLTPRAGEAKRGLVVGHGYGGRDQPDLDLPVTDTTILFPCFRGLSRSRKPPISADPHWHVLHDIHAPDRYILGGCVDDLWLAVSALISLFPDLEGRIGYAGLSFGGGIGALALAFETRVDRGHLAVPTFGNMPLWLTLPTTGSGAAVQNFLRTTGLALDHLRYFDAATAATRIQIPMLMAVARFDPVVAPACQFTVANALPTSNLHETVILPAGHFDYPHAAEVQAGLSEKIGRFFGTS